MIPIPLALGLVALVGYKALSSRHPSHDMATNAPPAPLPFQQQPVVSMRLNRPAFMPTPIGHPDFSLAPPMQRPPANTQTVPHGTSASPMAGTIINAIAQSGLAQQGGQALGNVFGNIFSHDDSEEDSGDEGGGEIIADNTPPPSFDDSGSEIA